MPDPQRITRKKNAAFLSLFMGSCLGERPVFPVGLGFYARRGALSPREVTQDLETSREEEAARRSSVGSVS